LAGLNFTIESDNPAAHLVSVEIGIPITGTYSVSGINGVAATTNLQAGQITTIALPMAAGTSPQPFALTLTK
jgi:hypothetical protein